MDIKPRRTRPEPAPITPPAPIPVPELQPIAEVPTGIEVKRRSPWKKGVLFGGAVTLGLLLVLFAGAWVWFQIQLAPVGSNQNELIKVTIEPATTPAQIGALLEEQKVIKSSFAFGLYARLTGSQNSLQAGAYRLSPAESTPEIIEHLTNGNVDTFDITFLPGSTLEDNRQVFLDAGFTEAEVDAGLSATYDTPLLDGRPRGADLEGYIYGDTYRFGTDASVEDILNHVFDFYYQAIVDNDLAVKYKAQDLSLYEGITLASIIQREAIGGDEAQIAQVFLLRLETGMELGSDVTYHYIADKLGVERDPNLNSPYNTRRFPGLPPGPISVPGIAALKAVAEPAEGDYLYFLSGDDDVTYFARTLAEHEQNIIDHCKEKCSIL